MLRRMYDWCVAAAYKPYATWIMGTVSFVESSFFPIPPDVMLIPMSLARPDRAYYYAFICTVDFGRWRRGRLCNRRAALSTSVGQWLISLYGYGEKVDAFREAYAEYGMWIILLKGLTPIPYKIVTITSGFAGYNLLLFILFSVIARAGRFFVLAFLLHRYGDRARHNHRGAARILGHAGRHRHGGRHRCGDVSVLESSYRGFLISAIRCGIRYRLGGVRSVVPRYVAGLARWLIRSRTQCRCDPPVADGRRSLPLALC